MGNDGGVVKLHPTARSSPGWGAVSPTAPSSSRGWPSVRSAIRCCERVSLFTDGGPGAIVVYGDSITQVGGDWNGGASDTKHNWAMLLPGLIADRQPKAKVLVDARGIGGNVVYNGLCRAPQPEHADMDATLYLLEFGTNDVNRPWMPPERHAQGLRDFVRMLFVYSDADVASGDHRSAAGRAPADPADYHKAVITVAAEFKLPGGGHDRRRQRVPWRGAISPPCIWATSPTARRTTRIQTRWTQVWAQATVAALEKSVMQPAGPDEKPRP